MRLDSIEGGGKFKIDTITVSNCSGTLQEAGFVLGQESATDLESITGLQIANCNLTAPAILDLAANFGNVALSNITFSPLHTYESPGLAFGRTSPIYAGATYIGTNLTLDNCTIQRNADLSVTALIVEYNSSINDLVFNGFSVKDVGRYPAMSELINIVSGSIGQLIINALDSSNIKKLASSDDFLKIGSVCGTGVLATGWEFPDTVMADGVPYISATTGLPSIKIEGVVKPYTG